MTAELMEILQDTPYQYEIHYSTGHINVEFYLPVSAVDSAYVQQVAKGHDDAYLRFEIYCDFGTEAEELIEFIKEYSITE